MGIDTSTPFQLILKSNETDQGTNLTLILKNTSNKTERYLYDQLLQAGEISLVDKKGKLFQGFDKRELKSFDHGIYAQEQYRKLEKGEEIEIQTGNFSYSKDSGKYVLYWGMYEFKELEPGEYKAQVHWESMLDNWIDEKKKNTINGIWKGKIKSNEISIKLA